MRVSGYVMRGEGVHRLNMPRGGGIWGGLWRRVLEKLWDRLSIYVSGSAMGTSCILVFRFSLGYGVTCFLR